MEAHVAGPEWGDEVGDMGKGQMMQGFVDCDEAFGFSKCTSGLLHFRDQRKLFKVVSPKTLD